MPSSTGRRACARPTAVACGWWKATARGSAAGRPTCPRRMSRARLLSRRRARGLLARPLRKCRGLPARGRHPGRPTPTARACRSSSPAPTIGRIRTYLGVPLADEAGSLIGVFTLIRNDVRPFSPAQIALVQIVRGAGADRDEERAPDQRDAGGAGAPDGDEPRCWASSASSVDDAQPVFDKIVDSGAQLFPATACRCLVTLVEAEVRLHWPACASSATVGGRWRSRWPAAERAVAAGFPTPLAGTATERRHPQRPDRRGARRGQRVRRAGACASRERAGPATSLH